MLESAGVTAWIAANPSMLLEAARTGDAGAFLLTQEAFSSAFLAALTEALAAQPGWSDLPVVVLTPGGRQSSAGTRAEAALGGLMNATLLERPIRASTLISAMRSALKSRERQYEIRRVSEERDRATATLIQSEKLAAVGRLAASISHEINNPLESMTNLLYLLRQDAALSDSSLVYLDLADQELQRAAHITKQSLGFHRQSTRPVSITAEDLLAPLLAIYDRRIKNSSIELHTEFLDQKPIVCYENDMRQVFSNLIGNAIDAMRTGGRLRIRARSENTRGVDGLSILIGDTGHGMDREVLKRVFEAFYTTKGNNGTGLGLWISAGIVAKHGGTLRVRSSVQPGRRGTVFKLFMPAVS